MKKRREIIDKNFRVWTDLSQISRKKFSRILCKDHIHVKKMEQLFWSLVKKTFAFEKYSRFGLKRLVLMVYNFQRQKLSRKLPKNDKNAKLNARKSFCPYRIILTPIPSQNLVVLGEKKFPFFSFNSTHGTEEKYESSLVYNNRIDLEVFEIKISNTAGVSRLLTLSLLERSVFLKKNVS